MMENLASVAVSGTSCIARQCSKCERKNARGVYMVREQDGRHIFKCDICGMKRSMGWTEASHLLMIDHTESYKKAGDNRERWRREFTEKFNEDFNEAVENIETRPDVVENFDQMLSGPGLDKRDALEEDHE